MTLRNARLLAGLYVCLGLFFVTWPGMLPFARVRPFVLGLPFAMAWIALWVAGTVVVFWLLDRVERRHREDGPEQGTSAAQPRGDA